jgi:hypothetical protein
MSLKIQKISQNWSKNKKEIRVFPRQSASLLLMFGSK